MNNYNNYGYYCSVVIIHSRYLAHICKLQIIFYNERSFIIVMIMCWCDYVIWFLLYVEWYKWLIQVTLSASPQPVVEKLYSSLNVNIYLYCTLHASNVCARLRTNQFNVDKTVKTLKISCFRRKTAAVNINRVTIHRSLARRYINIIMSNDIL